MFESPAELFHLYIWRTAHKHSILCCLGFLELCPCIALLDDLLQMNIVVSEGHSMKGMDRA